VDRVFLDANVLFSAAWRADSGLRRLFGLDGTVLVTSAYAVEEARRNLESGARRERLEALLGSVEILDRESPFEAIPGHVRLPVDDRPILAAALAARCTHLLSGDIRAFGPLFGTKVAGVLVLRPADYLGGADVRSINPGPIIEQG
jgi:hypothetical protein